MSHFERFNKGARAVLVRAQNEAIPRDHTLITPTHLLLGLIRERRGIASKVLRGLNLPEPALILALDFGPDEWKRGKVGEIELSNRAKNLLMSAVTEWQALNHQQIGTDHLLLGLCREEEQSGSGILQSLGMDPKAVRAEVLRLYDKRQPNRIQRFWVFGEKES